MAEFVGFDNLPHLEADGIVINVWPNPDDPGRNVLLLILLLQKWGYCGEILVMQPVKEDWWHGLYAEVEQRRSLERHKVYILDYVEEGYGGDSDMMIRLRAKFVHPHKAAEKLVEILKANGHEAYWEAVSFDGSADVFIPTLLVTGRINIQPPKDFL